MFNQIIGALQNIIESIHAHLFPQWTVTVNWGYWHQKDFLTATHHCNNLQNAMEWMAQYPLDADVTIYCNGNWFSCRSIHFD